jgi:voltage-gated sodium channel
MNNAVLAIISKVNESRRLKEQNRVNQQANSRESLKVNDVSAAPAEALNSFMRAASNRDLFEDATNTDGVDTIAKAVNIDEANDQDFNNNLVSEDANFGSGSSKSRKVPGLNLAHAQASTSTKGKQDSNSKFADNNNNNDTATGEAVAPAKIEVATNAKIRKINEMTGLLIEAWRGRTHAEQHYEEIAETLTPIARRLQAMKKMAQALLDSTVFHIFLVILIAVSSMLVGVELDMASTENDHIFRALEALIVSCFCLELLVRIIAVEFDLFHFFTGVWNCFDAFVIVGSLLPGSNSVVLLLRLVRVFRLLRLLKMFPELQTIVQALLSGIASIRYVGAIIAFSFYIFGLIGVFMFANNDPEHFGTLDAALITLLSIVTLDNWGDIMYRNMLGCDVYPPPEYGDDAKCGDSNGLSLLAAAYFIIFIIINTFVLLTLFIGVVTTSMEAASSEKREELKVQDKLNEMIQSGAVTAGAVDLYKRVFTLLDTDGSGSIEIAEIQMGLSCVKFTPSNMELQKWLTTAGLDPLSGSYNLVEFVKFMMYMKRRASYNRLKDAVHRVAALIKEHRLQDIAQTSPQSSGKISKSASRDSNKDYVVKSGPSLNKDGPILSAKLSGKAKRKPKAAYMLVNGKLVRAGSFEATVAVAAAEQMVAAEAEQANSVGLGLISTARRMSSIFTSSTFARSSSKAEFLSARGISGTLANKSTKGDGSGDMFVFNSARRFGIQAESVLVENSQDDVDKPLFSVTSMKDSTVPLERDSLGKRLDDELAPILEGSTDSAHADGSKYVVKSFESLDSSSKHDDQKEVRLSKGGDGTLDHDFGSSIINRIKSTREFSLPRSEDDCESVHTNEDDQPKSSDSRILPLSPQQRQRSDKLQAWTDSNGSNGAIMSPVRPEIKQPPLPERVVPQPMHLHDGMVLVDAEADLGHTSTSFSVTMPLTNQNSFDSPANGNAKISEAATTANSSNSSLVSNKVLNSSVPDLFGTDMSKVWTKQSMKQEGTLLDFPLAASAKGPGASTRTIVRSLVAI